jgi:hypothetical protein
MPGKKQKATLSLADALAATRSAHRRVVALAARLEATEKTILAAMASTPAAKPAAPAAAAAAPAKRPVGRPRIHPIADAPAAPKTRRTRTASTTTAKRPVGRPRG